MGQSSSISIVDSAALFQYPDPVPSAYFQVQPTAAVPVADPFGFAAAAEANEFTVSDGSVLPAPTRTAALPLLASLSASLLSEVSALPTSIPGAFEVLKDEIAKLKSVTVLLTCPMLT